MGCLQERFDYYSSSDRIRCYNSFCLCFSKTSSRRGVFVPRSFISPSGHAALATVISHNPTKCDWLADAPSPAPSCNHHVHNNAREGWRWRYACVANHNGFALYREMSSEMCVACLQLICVLHALSLCTGTAVLARTDAKVPLHVPRHSCPPQLTPLICLLSVCVSC